MFPLRSDRKLVVHKLTLKLHTVFEEQVSCAHQAVWRMCNCLTCPTSAATIFVAHRKHRSLSRNIQEELEAALLFQ